MSFRRYCSILVLALGAIVPWTSFAQQTCMGPTGTATTDCTEPNSCTQNGGCKSGVTCKSSGDCLLNSSCFNGRCTCVDNESCGDKVRNQCVLPAEDAGPGTCRFVGEPPNCTSECTSNYDCEVASAAENDGGDDGGTSVASRICIFTVDNSRGLCCPPITPDDGEESFTCTENVKNPMDGTGPVALVLLLGALVIIRSRS